jgi:hypothetical protein
VFGTLAKMRNVAKLESLALESPKKIGTKVSPEVVGDGKLSNAGVVDDAGAVVQLEAVAQVSSMNGARLSSRGGSFETGVSKFDTLFVESEQFSKISTSLNRRGVTLIDDASRLDGEKAFVLCLDDGQLAMFYNSKTTNFLDVLHESRHISQIQRAENTGLLGNRSPFSSQVKPLFERSAYEYELRLGDRFGFSESYQSKITNILTSPRPGGEGYTKAFESRFFNLGSKTREFRLFNTIEPRLTTTRFFNE